LVGSEAIAAVAAEDVAERSCGVHSAAAAVDDGEAVAVEAAGKTDVRAVGIAVSYRTLVVEVSQ
jgi:hypothetical protein